MRICKNCGDELAETRVSDFCSYCTMVIKQETNDERGDRQDDTEDNEPE